MSLRQSSLRLQEIHIEWSLNKQTQRRETILWAVGEVGSIVVDPGNLLVNTCVTEQMLYLLWVWERIPRNYGQAVATYLGHGGRQTFQLQRSWAWKVAWLDPATDPTSA